MWLMIILKATKNQGFTLSSEDTFFEKQQRERGEGGQNEPRSSCFWVNNNLFKNVFLWVEFDYK